MSNTPQTSLQDNNPNLLPEMLAALPDPVFVLTEKGQYVALIGGQDRTLYHDGAHLVDFSLYDVLDSAKADWFLQQIRLTLKENCLRIVRYQLAGEEVSGIDTDSGPSGEIWFEGRIQPLPSRINGDRAVVWVASNVTEQYHLEQELQRLSERDELTAAYNRRKLIAELTQRLSEFHRYNTSVAFMLLDIDHFKHINDQQGHLAGDEVLKQIAALCAEQLRATDLFFRYGGEEFAILLPNTDMAHARQAGDRIRKDIEGHRCWLDCSPPLTVTVSLGICIVQPEDHSVEDIIRRTDEALYRAKDRGRNRLEIAC